MLQLRYALRRTVAPAVEPLTLEEAKLHLRIEPRQSEDDGLIKRLIAAARQRAESFSGRALIRQSWELQLDGFPRGAVDVPRPPLESVAAVEYIDEAGRRQSLDAENYSVDTASEPGRISPAWGRSWPPARAGANVVRARFTAGYGATPTDVPEDIRHALLLIVGSFYEYRQDAAWGQAPSARAGKPLAWIGRARSGQALPSGADDLLRPYRLVRA